MEEHIQQLHIVLATLKEQYFFAKLSKYVFAQDTIEYLGCVVSKVGVQVDSKKIQAMIDWPVPKSIKQLRGFPGLTGYYPKFVRGSDD